MPTTEKYLNFLYFFKSSSLNESLYLIDKLNKKLNNKQFLSKAPKHVISEQRRRKHEAEGLREQLNGALARLVTI